MLRQETLRQNAQISRLFCLIMWLAIFHFSFLLSFSFYSVFIQYFTNFFFQRYEITGSGLFHFLSKCEMDIRHVDLHTSSVLWPYLGSVSMCWITIVNIWISIYENHICELRINMSGIVILAVCFQFKQLKKQPEKKKKFRLERESNSWPCNTGAMLYSLSYEAEWIGGQLWVRNISDDSECIWIWIHENHIYVNCV